MVLVAGITCLGEVSAAEPMELRVYPVVPACVERMSLDEDAEVWMKKDGDEDSLEAALGLLGVDWPEGSSIVYVKTAGTLNVRNTPENLAKFEKILDEFALKPFNVEIDTRFVETGRAALEAVGYFDTNRVDAAVLQDRLMARPDAKLLESVRVVTRPGEEAVGKQVVEYIYPTDYDLQMPQLPAGCVALPCTGAVPGMNSCQCVLGALEPQSFTMREVGPIVQVTPVVTDGAELIDLELRVDLVGEPEWKDYGAKAKWEGATTYDLPMEQPFFPVRASVDTKVSVRPGRTLVFGGVTDSRRANENKFVLVFVTARLVDCDGGGYAPPSRCLSAPEVRRKFESEGMESWTFYYQPSFIEALRACPDPDARPKTKEEKAAEVAEDERRWKDFFTETAGVEWPEGSNVHELRSLNRIWIKNTPENLAKVAKAWTYIDGKNIEFDIRYISADRKALSDVGYFGTNRVNAAVLQDRLMAHGGARLLELPRLVTRPGEETVLKGLTEYIYPTDYDVLLAEWNQTVGTNTVYGNYSTGAAVEPQSFTMREVGTFVQITPTLTDDGNFIDIELNTQLVGEPEWKDYGAKAKWKGAATYDLPMEQPFFPVRASADTKVGIRPGATSVFCGGADRRKGDEDKFVFIFVTPRFVEP
ncbi:MAG: hypothetical protein IKQ17_00385 [Kiritimatiellae bacterium]|nr:hypothetical protein [Kiritimatiellia bacterium]